MSKSLRLSEAWFRRGMWLVAIVFAGFLTGLGAALIRDLPAVAPPPRLEDFMDAGSVLRHQQIQESAERRAQEVSDALARARQQHQVLQADVAGQRETFANWIATRRATGRAEQDPEVIERTRALDDLAQRERAARQAVQMQEQRLLEARQEGASASRSLDDMRRGAQQAWTSALRQHELKVFGWRLALTLPLLLVAGRLFRRHRQGRWWPFAWGFILFALVAFFVELVPYLPSYGGYVRHLVGVAVTLAVGRWLILRWQAYLAKQREAEAVPEPQRRRQLDYDTAQAHLAKGACPGCERPVDLKDSTIDFCPHCGIGLFDRCGPCGARKSAFTRFCHACGRPAAAAADAG